MAGKVCSELFRNRRLRKPREYGPRPHPRNLLNCSPRCFGKHVVTAQLEPPTTQQLQTVPYPCRRAWDVQVHKHNPPWAADCLNDHPCPLAFNILGGVYEHCIKRRAMLAQDVQCVPGFRRGVWLANKKPQCWRVAVKSRCTAGAADPAPWKQLPLQGCIITGAVDMDQHVVPPRSRYAHTDPSLSMDGPLEALQVLGRVRPREREELRHLRSDRFPNELLDF